MKATVTLGGVPLTGVGAVAWRFQTGVHPYTATFNVSNKNWKTRLFAKKGQPLELVVKDTRGTITRIKDLYILYEAPSQKPSITSFVVADRRWKWERSIIIRDYNLSKRTGDINFDKVTLPLENRQPIPKYDYRPFSLREGDKVWGAKAAIVDILEQIEGKDTSGSGEARFKIDGFAPSGEFSVQSISLNDPGNLALQRLLSFVPGTDVYIDQDGFARVINTLDIEAGERYLDTLPRSTWAGDKDELVDYKKIRPNSVNVYYERELEVVLDYEDDFDPNSQLVRGRDDLWCENVIPTVYPETDVLLSDPETGGPKKRTTVPPGTWVPAIDWLEAHNRIKPTGSLPWTFATLRVFWLKGNLDGLLAGTEIRGSDKVDTTNVLQAIRVLREHFRQTFRISRRYMERFRDIKPIRVALLDPITGQRAGASVWGQMTVAPTFKGISISSRADKDKAGMYYLINSLPEESERLVTKAPGPQQVMFLDRDVGIFRLQNSDAAFGTYAASIPGLVTGSDGVTPKVPVRDLSRQDDPGLALGAGYRMQNGTNEFILPNQYKFKVMLTVVPGAPNNKNRLHKEPVNHDDILDMYNNRVKIERGEGPPIEVFVGASEATARYAWVEDENAERTIADLIGLNDDDPTKGGLTDNPNTQGRDESRYPAGFEWINEQREIYEHSRAVAAGVYSAYVNGRQGRVATRVPDGGKLQLTGNMLGASLKIDSHPSARVSAMHEFRGRTNPIDRAALMPEEARKVFYGIVRFSKD